MGLAMSHMSSALSFISTRGDLKSSCPRSETKKQESMSSAKGAESRTFLRLALCKHSCLVPGLLNHIMSNPVEDPRNVQSQQLVDTPSMSEQHHLHDLITFSVHCIIQAPTPKYKPLDSCRHAKASRHKGEWLHKHKCP